MEHSTPAISKLRTQLLKLRLAIDSLQEQINDMTLSEDDSDAVNAYLVEKEQGALLTEDQVSAALDA